MKRLKKGRTKVKCHCGKVTVVVETPVPVDSQIDIWCSKPCRDDWATGGM